MLQINKLLILRKKKKDHAGENLHYPWDYAFCFLHPSSGFPNPTDILYKLIRNWQHAVTSPNKDSELYTRTFLN